MARKHQTKKAPSVACGYIHPGTVHAGFAHSLVTAVQQTPIAHWYVASSPRPTTSRNLVIQQFLEGPDEYLWMVDTDMTFPPDTLAQMLTTARRLPQDGLLALSAVNYAYDANTAELTPVVMLYDQKSNRYLGSHLYPDDGKPFRIDATGPACMLIHRKILEDIRDLNETGPSYWFYDLAEDDWFTGNDIVFCDRLRRAGHQIWVDPNITTGHIKSLIFDKRLYLAQRETRFGF